MSAPWLGPILVAMALLWSVLVVLQRLLPGMSKRLREMLVLACTARGWHRLAQALQVPAPTGCDNGCTACSGRCSTPVAEQVVRWPRA